MRRVVVAAIALSAVVFLSAATVQWLRPSVRRNDIVTARVERGVVEATIAANGTVVPLIEKVISSPVEARVLRIGRRAGDHVRAGDEILTLDTAASRLDAERLTQRLRQKENELTQLRLKLDDDIETLAAQLEQKKLDAQILHYTAEQKRKLRTDGLAAEQEVLAADALAKKSDIEIAQIAQALQRARRSRDAQLAAAQDDLGVARGESDEARRQLDLAMLRADRDGILTWVITEEGATVRRGDVLARVADLTSYRIAATASDIHASTIRPGQRVHVTTGDNERIDGVVESVDPRIEGGALKFFVALDNASDPRLRNNLRVDVAVVTGRRANVMRVRRGALARSDAEHAFVIRGDEARRADVGFGVAGDDYIEITSGLAEGDEVVISDMNEYKDLMTVRVR